jgi:2-C-methyl-D-erythritol 2,4-cyclodiphosphate synthase/2-C-methyl-D-erythritol 4-phosphate cytidylyltransferase
MADKLNMQVTAVILAGGSGTRMGADTTKQQLIIGGMSVLRRTVLAFAACPSIDNIVAVVKEGEEQFANAELCDIEKLTKVVVGGSCRAMSAKLGFEAVPANCDLVAIHDAARMLITPDDIDRVVRAAASFGAATAVSKVYDTVKLVDDGELISRTLTRENVRLAQTPQVFKRELYQRALEEIESLENITDDNMMAELIGAPIRAVVIEGENLKITTPKDIRYAEFLLRERGEAVSGIRVGHGYDVHRLVPDRRLIIGGVDIPFEKGLLGHSDADVLLHAIMDSILGALALGDIGRHFPDSDERWRGVSSLILLAEVGKMLLQKGARIVNIDATVILQRPKIAAYVAKMAENIALTLGIDKQRVNIKATTEEHLGFTGSGEGASAHAVTLIEYI